LFWTKPDSQDQVAELGIQNVPGNCHWVTGTYLNALQHTPPAKARESMFIGV
jgi:hypothetical protein